MLILLLDAAIIIGLFTLFSGGESLSWGKAILTAFAISLFCFGCIYFLFDFLGVWSLLPCLLVAPVMLWLLCDLPLKQSAIAGSIFTAYRIALTFGLILLAWCQVRMQISLRSLMMACALFGALPLLVEYWLIPFFAILAICVGMSLRAFASEFRDDAD